MNVYSLFFTKILFITQWQKSQETKGNRSLKHKVTHLLKISTFFCGQPDFEVTVLLNYRNPEFICIYRRKI